MAICLAVGALALTSGFIRSRATTPAWSAVGGDGAAVSATVVRSPTCGCCGNYASYLKRRGFDVKTEFLEDGEARRAAGGVPDALASCHTTYVGGYVVEGHVPVEAIDKLLKEKPAVKGIGLPAMPSGSPGMPGPKREPWEVRSFTEDGTTSPFMTL